MSLAQQTLPPVFSPDFMIDPYPRIVQLREEEPVHWVEDHSLWFVTRYDDVRRLFADAEVGTPDSRAWSGYVRPPAGSYLEWLADHSLFALEHADHLRVRRLVTAALTPKAVARMDAQIEAVVEKFAAPLRGRQGVVDVMTEFTDPIPNTVISRITGIPPTEGDEVRFRSLAAPVVANALPFAPPEAAEQAEAALVELTAWIRELAQERKITPRDDMISDLATTHDMGEGLTTDEILMMVSALILAGSETTALGGMIALMTLLDHPDVFDALKADGSLIPRTVLEIIRHGLGGPGTLPRYALCDFELHGKHIRKGEMMMLSFGGANRDPSIFENPDEFDINRDNSRLLNFGFGAHHCLGAHLAKAEIGAMVRAACDFLPTSAKIRYEQMKFRPVGTFPRPTTLPIDFGA